MARDFTFSALSGTPFDVTWPQAGDKQYSGIALVKLDAKTGHVMDMFRLSDKATPAQYRALATAATELATLAEQCAVVAEQATKVTYSKGQLERIREALKDAKPDARVGIAVALDVDLADFGYEANGKPRAMVPQNPPKANADAKLASVLGSGK